MPYNYMRIFPTFVTHFDCSFGLQFPLRNTFFPLKCISGRAEVAFDMAVIELDLSVCFLSGQTKPDFGPI